jgi:O-antigen biosynthesis protein
MAEHHSSRYYSQVRSEIVDLVPPATKRLLSIGCGSGATEKHIKELYRIAEVSAFEREGSVSDTLRSNVDSVNIGNVEENPLPYPDEHFDAVLTLDVLEHLVDPEKILKECKRVMKPDGVLIVSIPNIRHHEILLRLSAGDFYSRPEGILDYTHLHFFTNKTIIDMLTRNGFTIEVFRRKYQIYLYRARNRFYLYLQKIHERLASHRWFYSMLDHVPLIREYYTFQYVLRLRKEDK